MLRTFAKLITLAGCGLILASPVYADDSQFVGTILGAGIGGLVGSTIGHGDGRAAATGAGIVLGGVIGNELSRPSYYGGGYYPRSTYYSYDYPSPVYYYAPYQPNYVAPPGLPPQPQPMTYIDSDSGSYCREFSQAVRIGNRIQETFGTACLQPDGSWHIVQ